MYISSNAPIARSTVKCSMARARAAAPIVCRRVSSRSSRRQASARTAGLRGGTTSPATSPTASLTPPTSVATLARPQAIASMSV